MKTKNRQISDDWPQPIKLKMSDEEMFDLFYKSLDKDDRVIIGKRFIRNIWQHGYLTGQTREQNRNKAKEKAKFEWEIKDKIIA